MLQNRPITEDTNTIATTVVKVAETAVTNAVTKVIQTSSNFSKLLFVDDVSIVPLDSSNDDVISKSGGSDASASGKKGNRGAHQSLELSRDKADERM